MVSTHIAELPIPLLPLKARTAHIVPALQSQSLLSIGTLCDAGCDVNFTTTAVTVRHDGAIVLEGTRTSPGLWKFVIPVPSTASPNFTQPPTHEAVALSTIGYPNAAELVAYAHAAMFSPALSTLEKALQQGYVRNLPGLTTKTLRRHPPQSVDTAKGHLDQTRKNLRSTKSGKPQDLNNKPVTSVSPDEFPEREDKSHHCYVAVQHIEEPTGKVYTDQTGKFPCTSASGNNYIMIIYDYDSNAILMEPIRNRKGPTLLAAHQKLHARLTKAGLRPRYIMLDNECSNALKEFFNAEAVAYQLTPAGIHRRNTAERSIRTAKNHLIAGLCTVNPKFPLYLWDKLLPQAELTLNMLRGSRLNPKLSAWDQVCGVYEYNRTPIGPPGTRVLVHDKPHQRGTWAPHGDDAWYIGPAFDHYRCYTVWSWETRREKETDTLSWFPHNVRMPTPSALDRIGTGIHDIANVLKNPTPGSPLSPLDTIQIAALNQLLEMLTAILPETANDDTESTDDLDTTTQSTNTPDAQRLRVPNNSPGDPSNSPTYADITKKRARKKPQPAPPTHTNETPEPSTPATHVPSPATKPLAMDVTTPADPTPRETPQAPPPPPTTVLRRRGKRKRRPPKHFLAATVTPAPADPDIMPIEPNDIDFHWALHDTAINPDTGLVAEYEELSRSSVGAQWIQSNTEEWGHQHHLLYSPQSDATGAHGNIRPSGLR